MLCSQGIKKKRKLFFVVLSVVLLSLLYFTVIEENKTGMGLDKEIVIVFNESLHQTGRFRLAGVFDHHMVLQRGRSDTKIWGWCGEEYDCSVTARLNGEPNLFSSSITNQISSQFNSSHIETKWVINLPAKSAGGPHTIYLVNNNTEGLVIRDVFFGDVYTCVGQSNMLFTVSQTFSNRDKPLESYEYPKIRLLSIGVHQSRYEEYDLVPELPWTKASENAIIVEEYWTYFSAACWYFGKALHEAADVPIGLISMAANGSPLQTWVPHNVVETCGIEERAEVECCPTQDSVCWNAMVMPTIDLRINGVIFYQGESNLFNTQMYECLFPLFVYEWRAHSNQMDLPFFIVELAPLTIAHPYMEVFREMQRNFTKSVPKTHLISTIDLGDYQSPFGDLHPRLKEEIGERGCAIALKVLYGKDINVGGPVLDRVATTLRGTWMKIEITFKRESVGETLILKPFECPRVGDMEVEEYCTGFEVEFGNSVIVQCSPIIGMSTKTIVLELDMQAIAHMLTSSEITRVNYAFSGFPQAILYNSRAQPAVPFSIELPFP